MDCHIKGDIMSISGWLSPDGCFYGCKAFEHTNKADEICSSIYDVFSNHPDVELLSRGWIHFTLLYAYMNENCTITDKQLLYINRSAVSKEQMKGIVKHLGSNMRRQRYYDS